MIVKRKYRTGSGSDRVNAGNRDLSKVTTTRSLPLSVLTFLITFSCCACGPQHPLSKVQTFTDGSTVTLRPNGNEGTILAVRFLEDRVKGDPDDLVALNKLSAYYLQLHGQTEDLKYLELALHSAKASLRVLPDDQNLGGLKALAQAEFETHNFVSARDLAREITEYEPQKAFGYQLLGDASLELGDYDQAEKSYRQLEILDPATVATQTRLAHLAVLWGDLNTARRRYFIALELARSAGIPSAETIAWCLWQIGELRFDSGDYEEADKNYREALAEFPHYTHAVTSLAGVRAARGDLTLAISLYESVMQEQVDPVDAAALGDLYKLVGRDADADRMYRYVERLCQRNDLSKALYNRQLVWFWANHDEQQEDAFARARKEYEMRRDVYGADALAWSALKAGKIREATAAMKEALRLGTRDPKFFYHAGMIARAAGDDQKAREYLSQAINQSPQFDPLQAAIAKKALQSSN